MNLLQLLVPEKNAIALVVDQVAEMVKLPVAVTKVKTHVLAVVFVRASRVDKIRSIVVCLNVVSLILPVKSMRL
ncbi:hypothetical protein D3C78_1470350 [compost metagenome]